MKMQSSASNGTTRSHSIRGVTFAIATKTMTAAMFTQKVMVVATEAESGTRIGGNAIRLRVTPPRTIEGSITDTESMKNRKSRIPINR